jgi:hypothetical protein
MAAPETLYERIYSWHRLEESNKLVCIWLLTVYVVSFDGKIIKNIERK